VVSGRSGWLEPVREVDGEEELSAFIELMIVKIMKDSCVFHGECQGWPWTFQFIFFFGRISVVHVWQQQSVMKKSGQKLFKWL
jgi:hypothetical protein